MTVPNDAALRVLWGLAVGAFLGLCYDFLRPLRQRHNAPADGVFALVTLLAWAWYSFKICLGDIRLGGTVSLGLGMLLWMGTVSMAVRKVFYWFWLVIFRIFSVFFLPFAKFFKKIRILIKKVFAYGKKRGYNIMRKEMPPQYPEEPTMNKQTNSKEQTQNANVWVKMAVLLVIIISTAALLITYVSISRLRDTNRKLEQQAIELEEDNKDLQNYVDHKDTDEGIKDVATGELGMVDPDTVIYDFD